MWAGHTSLPGPHQGSQGVNTTYEQRSREQQKKGVWRGEYSRQQEEPVKEHIQREASTTLARVGLSRTASMRAWLRALVGSI